MALRVVQFAAQPLEHTVFRLADGAGGHAEVPGNVGGRVTVDSCTLERLPGAVLKIPA